MTPFTVNWEVSTCELDAELDIGTACWNGTVSGSLRCAVFESATRNGRWKIACFTEHGDPVSVSCADGDLKTALEIAESMLRFSVIYN